MFRHEAQRANLAPVADRDADVDDAPQADGPLASEAHWRRPDHATFDGVPGYVHVRADDGIVANLEQIVIADRERVHIDAAAEARAVEAQVRRPHRRR